MKFDVKKLNVSGYYQPCFCVFDILLLNDKVLRNETLAHRLKLLRKTFKTTFPGVIILSDYEESTSRKQIIDALNRTMDKEEEGIIVKEPSSIYKYRDRNSGWYKLKLEYFEEAVTDLDLILMGGYYKTNSRELNSFLVGVISDSYANVLSMGTVSSGLNFEEIEAVNKKLSEMGHPYDEFSSKSKGKLMFGKEVPDVWIEPEDSLVFTVRATELIRCRGDGFQTPYTLRFPRILNVRDDKPYRDCMSISELKEICQNKAVVKLNKRYLQLDDIPIIKRSKQTKSLQIDVDALSKTSNLLEGLKFYVLNGREDYSVNKIEMLIERFGGTFTFSLQTDVSIVLFGSLTSKVEELLKKENKFDVIKVEWLQRVIDTECIQRYKQDEVLSIGLSYYNCLADDVDLFGDSYIEEVNAEYMRSRLDTMALSSFSTNLNESVHFKSDLPLFNTYIAYFDRYEVVNDPSSHHIYNSFLDEIEFRYRKGTIADTLNPEVNLIVAELCNKKENPN
ncbi:hypothetical protein HHI36_023334 [Cryptolaemus montrouzieri]|uniref:DNA ligase 4 n=1 Tax=Cryptolaemus montrouzieri TaxID=559131 RepID=A0ABD2PG38_9CUCU